MLSISLLLILNKIFFDVSCGCFAILDVCSALTRVTTVFPKIYFFKLCFIASITKNLFPEVFDVILLWGLFWKKKKLRLCFGVASPLIRHQTRAGGGGWQSWDDRRTKVATCTANKDLRKTRDRSRSPQLSWTDGAAGCHWRSELHTSSSLLCVAATRGQSAATLGKKGNISRVSTPFQKKTKKNPNKFY